MGWGLRPRGYSGTRRYVREYRLYAVEGFTGTNSLYGFRMGEGGFGAPPVGDVTHGIFLGGIWDFLVSFHMRLPDQGPPSTFGNNSHGEIHGNFWLEKT